MIKLFVGNLSYSAMEDDVSEFFSSLGCKPSKVTIPRDRETNKARGFGFVEFDDPEDADNAMEQANGYVFQGRKLNVSVARPPERRERNNR